MFRKRNNSGRRWCRLSRSVNNFCTWLVMPDMLLINAYSVINGCSSFPALYITDLMMASMTVELLPRLGCANIVVTGLSGRLLMDVDCWAKKPMLAHFPKSKCPFYPGVCSWHLAIPQIPPPRLFVWLPLKWRYDWSSLLVFFTPMWNLIEKLLNFGNR